MDDRGLLDLVIRRIPGLSPGDRLRLCRQFNREGELSALSRRDLEEVLGRSLSGPLWNMEGVQAQAERDAALARMRGIGYVSYTSPLYPPLLREILDPPALLFFRGVLPDPERPLAAVVGTRKPSGAAMAQAYDIARDLGRGGLAVVSGLALGIDALAHRGNLDGGAPTAAVLGSGLDKIYPASNRMLARRILEEGGVLFSEYPPGTGPMKWHFPARNRIISGLARWTIVVEAPARSGALITGHFALEQGRDLWVASSGIGSQRGAGTRKFAEDGAGILTGASEILEEWMTGTEAPGFPLDRIASA